MPQESPTVRVTMPDGSTWNIPRENLIRARARGAVEVKVGAPTEPKLLDIAGMGTARGMGLDPERLQRIGANRPGIQAIEIIKNMMQGTAGWMEATAKDPAHITDPLEALAGGVEKGGKSLWSALTEDEKKDPKKIAAALGQLLGSTSMIAAGAEGREIAGKLPELPAKVAEAAGKAVEAPGKVARATVRSIADRDLHAVEKARKAAKEADAEKLKEYDKKVSETKEEATRRLGEARSKHETELREAKEAVEAKRTARREKLQSAVAKQQEAKIARSRAEGAERSLNDLKDRKAKQVADNLDIAERAERKSLDDRWTDFRKKVLGVSDEAPNGKLTADLSTVGNVIIEARKALVKGTESSVPIFNSILGRLKEMVETPDGGLRPLEGQTIPVDQLRGYFTEINDALYEKSLPNDVRNALKEVQKSVDGEIKEAIKDAGGEGAVKSYDALKKDYSDYMDTWRDISSGSPLPRIWKILRSPVASKMGIPVYRQVADILLGKKGEAAIPIIARKRTFGTDPNLLGELRSTQRKIESLPTAPKVPEVKVPPEVPEAEIPKSVSVNIPAPPERPSGKPFDAHEFVKEGIAQRMRTMGHWGTGMAVVAFVLDLLHGNAGAALTAAERVAAVQVAKAYLTSEKFLKWATKGVPQ